MKWNEKKHKWMKNINQFSFALIWLDGKFEVMNYLSQIIAKRNRMLCKNNNNT